MPPTRPACSPPTNPARRGGECGGEGVARLPPPPPPPQPGLWSPGLWFVSPRLLLSVSLSLGLSRSLRPEAQAGCRDPSGTDTLSVSLGTSPPHPNPSQVQTHGRDTWRRQRWRQGRQRDSVPGLLPRAVPDLGASFFLPQRRKRLSEGKCLAKVTRRGSGGSDSPAVPAAPHGLARPEALYYQGPLLPIYPTPTMGSLFPLLNLPTPLYPMVCSMEHPLSADIAVATRADEDGDTPLHIAVVQGNLGAVHRLVSLFQHGGRELDIYNNLRQTPLHLAVITTLPSVVRLLVMAGASPMALDRHGQTAAHLACEHRSPTCLRALLDSAAPGTVDLEARNYDGLTALHVAVNMECPEAVLLLLERGADIDAVDIKSGRSPLIHAVENNSLSMVQLLLQHGANVNAQMYSGSSALHSASGRGLLPLVRTLVRSGADSGLKNCHNDTPLMVARSRRVIDILRGKATRPAPASQPEPSPERSATTSPESSSLLSSNGLLSASPSSSPSQSPPKDPPGFPMAPPSFFLPPSSPPAFLPFAGVLRAPGRPVPPSPAPGGS